MKTSLPLATKYWGPFRETAGWSALLSVFITACASGPIPADDARVDASVDSASSVAMDSEAADRPASIDANDDRAEADVRVCEDRDGDGHRSAQCGGDDCDDGDVRRHPGATESCNDVDDDCDGVVDNDSRTGMSLRQNYYRDSDGDGFGDRSAMGDAFVRACEAPAGFVANNSDCDDRNVTINPSAREVCDERSRVDENCNGSTEENCACPRPGQTRACCSARGIETCESAPTGTMWGACSAPTSAETCNALDDDCDGTVDNGLTVRCYLDRDDDGFAPSGAPPSDVCPDPSRGTRGNCPIRYTDVAPTSAANTDCDDASDTRRPGLRDVCDGTDNDCDALTADGAGDPAVGAPCSVAGALGRCAVGTGICSSSRFSCSPVNVPLPELCNAMDDDCDGMTDEPQCVDNQTAPTGFGTCSMGGVCSIASCAPGRGNCDGFDGNGCEVRTDDDARNCGACGVRCAFGSCSAGRCVVASVVQLAMGYEGSCAVYSGGMVACWGRSVFSSTLNSTATLVAGLSDVVETRMGVLHQCVRRASGQVLCWGENGNGRLGDGTFEAARTVATAVPVVGLNDAVEVATGERHTCARRASGQVVCWGHGTEGQLGVSLGGTNTPVAVIGVSDAVELVAGARHTCARRASGEVLCWGANEYGQIGDETRGMNRTRATPVSGLMDAVEISAGTSFTCARRLSGAVVCWGANDSGQIGDGTLGMDRLQPTEVQGVTNAVELSVGDAHACARLSTGRVVCWGRNSYGQLGDGTSGTSRPAPVTVLSLEGAVEVSAGFFHTCARRTMGQVVCWGWGIVGELGDGTTFNRQIAPVAVTGLSDVIQMDNGARHSCAVLATGAIRCWGPNTDGCLGDGTLSTNWRLPNAVVGISDAREVTTGGNFSCARHASREVSCWGRNVEGQIGTGTTGGFVPLPRMVVGLTDVVELEAGNNHTCARVESGRVFCWGVNNRGQLGDGTTVNRANPTPVVGLTDAVEIAVGGSHSCARRTSGQVVCWGSNVSGQIGDGSGVLNRTTPVAVATLSDADLLSAGEQHTCARQLSGQLLCWGDNLSGQLGDGTRTNRATPTNVLSVSGATQISAGRIHTCARLSTGNLRCWGFNGSGELGDGTRTDAIVRVSVVGITDAVEVSAGGERTCARRPSGTIVCWGQNEAGQIGNRGLPNVVQGL